MNLLDFNLRDWADTYLDDEARQREFESLGNCMFAIFGTDGGKTSSQVRSLQSIVTSAVRFSDIELFIKNQMGRDNRIAQQWAQLDPHPIEQLRRISDHTNCNGGHCKIPADLRSIANEFAIQLRMHIAHAWARSVVGGYMFAKARAAFPDLQVEVNQ